MCNVVTVSGEHLIPSSMHTSVLFQIIFPYRLLQNIEHSSLCYTAIGACGLSALYMKVQVKVAQSVLSDFLRPHGLFSPWNSLGQNTGVGSL